MSPPPPTSFKSREQHNQQEQQRSPNPNVSLTPTTVLFNFVRNLLAEGAILLHSNGGNNNLRLFRIAGILIAVGVVLQLSSFGWVAVCWCWSHRYVWIRMMITAILLPFVGSTVALGLTRTERMKTKAATRRNGGENEGEESTDGSEWYDINDCTVNLDEDPFSAVVVWMRIGILFVCLRCWNCFYWSSYAVFITLITTMTTPRRRTR